MTTVEKRRGLKLKQWIADQLYKVDWISTEFKKKEEAVSEARSWNLTEPCPQCHREIAAHSQFCKYCRFWLDEEETRKTASLGDTSSLHTIRIDQAQYPIQYRGRRLFRVWMEDVRPLINDDDKWLREP